MNGWLEASLNPNHRLTLHDRDAPVFVLPRAADSEGG